VARLTPDNEQRARDLIALYPQPRSALIPMLHILQEQDGYLTEDGMKHIGEMLTLAPAEVRGTASFYDMFHTEPIGKYLVAVCTNIACMLQGAYELLDHIEERLGVASGGTTPDGNFTVEDAECLALCGNAPCLTVNWRFFGDVSTTKFDQLVDDLTAGRLADEVPAHGVLGRVRRNVGLEATGFTANSPQAGPDGRIAGTGAAATAEPAIAAPVGAAGPGTAGNGTPDRRPANGGIDLTTRATTPASNVLDGNKQEETA
jgi:NADH-quinone oxidoreductase subunit E